MHFARQTRTLHNFYNVISLTCVHNPETLNIVTTRLYTRVGLCVCVYVGRWRGGLHMDQEWTLISNNILYIHFHFCLWHVDEFQLFLEIGNRWSRCCFWGQLGRTREPAPVLFTMSTGTSSGMFLTNQEEFKSFCPGSGRKNQRCGMDTKSMNQHCLHIVLHVLLCMNLLIS